MNPSEIKRVETNPSWSKGVQTSPNESKWVRTSPNDSKLFQKSPKESRWIQVSPIESMWDQMNPNEFKLVQVGPVSLLESTVSNAWFESRIKRVWTVSCRERAQMVVNVRKVPLFPHRKIRTAGKVSTIPQFTTSNRHKTSPHDYIASDKCENSDRKNAVYIVILQFEYERRHAHMEKVYAHTYITSLTTWKNSPSISDLTNA